MCRDKIKSVLIEILIVLLLVMTLSTQYQELLSKYYVSRILGGAIAILAFCLFLMDIKLDSAIVCGLLGFSAVVSIITTTDIQSELLDWVYLFTTVFLFAGLFFADNKIIILEKMNKYLVFAKVLVVLESVSMAYMMILKIGYVPNADGYSFKGLCNVISAMGSYCCLLLSLILYVVAFDKKNGWKYAILSLIPSYALMQNGSRTFLVPISILLIYIVYYLFDNKKLKATVYALGFIAFSFLFLRSHMLDKILLQKESLNAFSSGRIGIWQEHLKFIFSGNLFEILFGKSFAEIGYSMEGSVFRSHNDIIYLLGGGGIVSVIAYLYILSKPLIKIDVNIVFKLLIFFYVLFPMLINGFFTYQHYVISFIFLYFAIVNNETCSGHTSGL
ncbi:MAG: hypothetical protein K6F82_07115 [Sphaerochaetaceae bacterium]|nr:hypothetical protein [Sphaerochaetaceae bacterium]